MYFAKTHPQETILEHTDKLLEQFYILKEYLKDKDLRYLNFDMLEICCIYHDFGKANIKFQNKIRKNLNSLDLPLLDEGSLSNEEEVYHNHLSPAFIPKEILKDFSELDKKVIIQSIYRHHKRKEEKKLIKKTLENMNKSSIKFDFNKSSYLKNIKINDELTCDYETHIERYISDFIYEDEDEREETIYKYILTKGLLNKIDYCASTIVDGKPIQIEIEPEDLEEKVKAFFDENNFSFNELQEYLLKNQNENNIVIAATGFGKTEAGLLWIGKNKGFFTLPLKVSINAIYDRFRDKINLGLLHSDTYSEYIKRSSEDNEEGISFDYRYYYETKQLSLPLTIATLDQLISFVFKYDGFELKLATLSYSKIIIDEIQMYSPAYLACLLYALKMITDVGGKFTILTATFPPVVKDMMDYLKIPFNMCEKEFYNNDLRHRVNVFEEIININHLKNNYDKDKKYLIICNTVKIAQNIYKQLKDDNFFENSKINLLHSRFIKKDRNQKENEILKMGNKNSKDSGIWVTTQIVEASLDIDFDILYTELSEINSLFQRMGRIYRSRVLKEDFTNIFVYVGTNEKYPSLVSKNRYFNAIDFNIFSISKEVLLEKQKNNIFDYNEKLKMDIVKTIYSRDNLKKYEDPNSYYRILNEILVYIKDLDFYKKGNEKLELRDIETTTFIPVAVLKDGNSREIFEIIDKIKNLAKQKDISSMERKILKQKYLDSLSGYYASIETNRFDEYKNDEYEEIFTIDKYVKIQVGNYKYDKNTGVILEKYEDEIIDNFF